MITLALLLLSVEPNLAPVAVEVERCFASVAHCSVDLQVCFDSEAELKKAREADRVEMQQLRHALAEAEDPVPVWLWIVLGSAVVGGMWGIERAL